MNINGWSEWSPTTYIRAAIVPSPPPAPKLVSATLTTINLEFHRSPDNGGSEITSYELYINDGDDANEPTT